MRMWMSGGEVAAHRSVLAKAGVERIGLNLSAYFKRRQPRKMDVDTFGGYHIVMHASDPDIDQLAARTFAETNIELFDYVYGIPAAKDIADIKYIPEYLGFGGIDEFYRLCDVYPNIGVSEAVALDPILMNQIRSFVSRNDTGLWINCSKTDIVGMRVWTDVLSAGWINAQKQRELQVWDGNKVSRYNRDHHDAGLAKFTTQIMRLGHDVDAIADGDIPAMQALALASWRMYELPDNRFSPAIAATGTRLTYPGRALDSPGALATGARQTRQREPVLLPSIALSQLPGETEDGEASVDTRLMLTGPSVRSCDPCIVNDLCPEFQSGASCAYEIPVSVKTKDERNSLISTVAELQTKRTLMSSFFEDLRSQGPTQETSTEIDRLSRIMKLMVESQQIHESITISTQMEREGGALSKIFGASVGSKAKELSSPPVIDYDIIEADVVEQ